MVHVDLNVSDLQYHTAAKTHANATAGALIGTYRDKKWTFVATAGDRFISTTPVSGIYDTVNGFTWSGGVRYDVSSVLTLSLTTGQDVLTTPLVTEGANFQHYLRAEATLRLF